ncbi:hypothetical protein ABT030_50685 [Streptomyces mirabilis]
MSCGTAWPARSFGYAFWLNKNDQAAASSAAASGVDVGVAEFREPESGG